MLALTPGSIVGWRSCDELLRVLLSKKIIWSKPKDLTTFVLWYMAEPWYDPDWDLQYLVRPDPQQILKAFTTFIIIIAITKQLSMLSVSLCFNVGSLKFRNNFLKTSVLFLKRLPPFVELVSTRAKAGLESRRVPYLNFSLFQIHCLQRNRRKLFLLSSS